MIPEKNLEVEGFIFTIKKWKVEDRGNKYFLYCVEYKGHSLQSQNELFYNMKQIRERILSYTSLVRMYHNGQKLGLSLISIKSKLTELEFL
jgi:hypothetical protein